MKKKHEKEISKSIRDTYLMQFVNARWTLIS